MSEYKILSDDLVIDLSKKYTFKKGDRVKSNEIPTMALIGGQPGAGKSAASKIAKMELLDKNGYVIVDADRLRETIPHNEKYDSWQTQDDARKLVHQTRKLALKNRFNIVEEGTFRDTDAAKKLVNHLNDINYKVDFIAVATSYEESLLGVYQRYELQKLAKSSNPRFVDENYQKEALAGFDKTVSNVDFDRVRVVNRSNDLLFDSHASHNKYNHVYEALVEGRKISDEKLISIAENWKEVSSLAHRRNANDDYLSQINSNIDRIENMKKERIHIFSLNNVDSNLTTLSDDERYNKYDKAELIKAAYYRGFYEKSSEFNKTEKSIENFDLKISKKENLDKLPNIEELKNINFKIIKNNIELGGHEI